MGKEFFGRVNATTIVSGLFLSLLFAFYWTIAAACGWLIGIAWSLINIYFIGLLIRGLTSHDAKRPLYLTLVFAVKIPVLYAIGFVLLSRGWFPLVPMLAGFIWPLVVITLKVLGRAILRLDDRKRLTQADGDLAGNRLRR